MIGDRLPGPDRRLVHRIGTDLASGEPVRWALAGGGMVHIDRPLPFLAVHRRPSGTVDSVTHRLLLGEAAHLHASVDSVPHDLLAELVSEIADRQLAAFGAFMLLELWGTEPDRPFRVVASRHHPPLAVLEELENSLLALVPDWGRSVVVDYREDWAPPDLLPLFRDARREDDGISHVGLEVPATYREIATDTVFPFELKDLRRELGRVLKRTFHTFTLSRTTRAPAHYHELGRQAVTEAVLTTDRELADISQKFDLLLHVTPVNASDAYREFSASGFTRPPEFLYRPRTVDPDLMKRRLYEVPMEEIEDPTLAHIYSEKRNELDRQLTMVADRNTTRFLLGSRQLFGDAESELVATAEKLLGQLSPTGRSGAPVLSAAAFAQRARDEIDSYRDLDDSLRCEVLVRDDIPGVLVSGGNLMVGADSTFPAERVDGLLAHEIGVHVLTHHNGHQQPLRELHAGMAGYESLQEGLAVLSEYLVGRLEPARLRQIAARVLAVQMITDGADFTTTFDELHRVQEFEPETAFAIVMRIYRGGGYTKDLVYLRGLVAVLGHLAEGRPLERLFIGKVAHEHLPLVEELEWRRVLVPPRLLPHHLREPAVQERLAGLASGSTVFDLAGEV